MWTKILIFMIIFFLVASPATFKIMRKLLGAWVASADGLATPAGLALHGVVLVLLAIYLPRVLMTYEESEDFEADEEVDEVEETEEYEDEEYEAEYEGYASIDDRVAALEGAVPASKLEESKKRLRRCPKCPKCSKGSKGSKGSRRSRSKGARRSRRSRDMSQPAAAGAVPPVTVTTTSGPNPQAILAPGAVAAASPNPVVITPPTNLAPGTAAAVGIPTAPPPAPSGTTSPYFEWNY